MNQIELNIVKNSNWPEKSQLATMRQIEVVVRVGLDPGTTGLRV